jgi:Rod binding domain-containing protein
MNLASLTASTLAPKPAQAQPSPEIKKAASEFEAMMLSQMLAPMFESLNSGGEFGGGAGEEMFRPMLVEQYAKGIARNGGIGLSDVIAREMMRMQGLGQPNVGEPNAAAG